MLNNPGKTLVIGTGSGRDIASSIIIKGLLFDETVEIDLAGFLTPWAIHFFNGFIEKPLICLNEVKLKKFQKFVIASNEEIEGFFEPYLFDIFNKFKIKVNNIYLFSLHYGFNKLFYEIVQLVHRNNYNTIIAVDVGGDVLADKKDYQTILTPLVDWTCLNILSRLSKDLPIYLAVVSPGACGEVMTNRIYEIIKEIKTHGFFLEKFVFDKDCESYQIFKCVNREINVKTNSYSHTFYVISKVVEEEHRKVSVAKFKKTYKIKNTTFEIHFERFLDRELIQSVYLFKIDQIILLKNHLKRNYQNLLEMFNILKSSGVCGTEIDLSAVPQNITTQGCKYSIYLLTPCCLVSGKLREDIIHCGFELAVDNKKINKVLILKSDFCKFNIKELKKFFHIYPYSKKLFLLCRK